jgi:hypothetical protein
MSLMLPQPVVDEDVDLAAADLSLPDSGAVVRHPDGYYWLAGDGHQQFGPFDSVEDALADMNASSEEDIEPCETVLEAEQELGIADWVDPDTGEPAEHTRVHILDN